VFETGNTIIDAIREAASLRPSAFLHRLVEEHRKHKIIIVTAHRRENQGEALQRICQAILTIIDAHMNAVIMFPLHPNPRVRQVVEDALSHHSRIVLLEPLRYADMAYLLRHSHALLTDSGGLQEESSAFSKPVLILRDQTERDELLHSGLGVLVGSNVERIIREANRVLNKASSTSSNRIEALPTPYGNGTASKQITQILLKLNREGLW
jgi:UDP-N-acetylglucosamine 2-epimerase (non-hydrolysing)